MVDSCLCACLCPHRMKHPRTELTGLCCCCCRAARCPAVIEKKGISLRGMPLYLDMQATTPLDPRVLDAMLPYMTEQVQRPWCRVHAPQAAAGASACMRPAHLPPPPPTHKRPAHCWPRAHGHALLASCTCTCRTPLPSCHQFAASLSTLPTRHGVLCSLATLTRARTCTGGSLRRR